MDDTDTNQEASPQSSIEDTPRQIDLRALGSPTFAPLSPVRIERSPPEEGKEEETKRESPEPETETLIRRIRFTTPLQEDPPSPLPPFEEPEPPIIMAGAPPTRDEFDRLTDQVTALTIAIGALTPRASSSVIADPNNFQRSPYAQPAPLDLNSKSGLHLYTEAQEALKVPFNGKAANVQPFLNSLAVEVKKYGLEPAVTVCSATGKVLPHYKTRD